MYFIDLGRLGTFFRQHIQFYLIFFLTTTTSTAVNLSNNWNYCWLLLEKLLIVEREVVEEEGENGRCSVLPWWRPINFTSSMVSKASRFSSKILLDACFKCSTNSLLMMSATVLGSRFDKSSKSGSLRIDMLHLLLFNKLISFFRWIFSTSQWVWSFLSWVVIVMNWVGCCEEKELFFH